MQARMDAEIVVYSKLSWKPGYQKYAVQIRRQNRVVNQKRYQNQESEFRS